MTGNELKAENQQLREKIGEQERELAALRGEGGATSEHVTTSGPSEEETKLQAELNDARKLIADMHAAAVGEVKGPEVGVVEDVAAVRTEYLRVKSLMDEATTEVLSLKAKVSSLETENEALKAAKVQADEAIADLQTKLTKAEQPK